MKRTALTLTLVMALLFSAVIVTFSVTAETENSWTTMTPMPTAVAGAKAAVVNGKIYVIVSTINYEYNPDTDTWATKKPMPTPRGDGIAVATYQNKIYVIGGRISGDEVSGINEVYDPATDTWETKTSMPTPRQELEANTVNGKIYLIGGVIPDPRYPPTSSNVLPTNITEVYDPTTDSWTMATSMPNILFNYASVVLDDKIYIIAGNSGDTTNQTQLYNPETDAWSIGAQIPNGVQWASAVATTGIMSSKAIYVIGGFVGFVFPVDFVQVYHPQNDSWSLGTPLPTARYGLAAAVVNDTIYAIGGGIGLFENATNQIDRYIPLRDGNEPKPEPSPTLLIVAVTVTVVAVVVVGLLVYFKKRKPKPES